MQCSRSPWSRARRAGLRRRRRRPAGPTGRRRRGRALARPGRRRCGDPVDGAAGAGGAAARRHLHHQRRRDGAAGRARGGVPRSRRRGRQPRVPRRRPGDRRGDLPGARREAPRGAVDVPPRLRRGPRRGPVLAPGPPPPGSDRGLLRRIVGRAGAGLRRAARPRGGRPGDRQAADARRRPPAGAGPVVRAGRGPAVPRGGAGAPRRHRRRRTSTPTTCAPGAG